MCVNLLLTYLLFIQGIQLVLFIDEEVRRECVIKNRYLPICFNHFLLKTTKSWL